MFIIIFCCKTKLATCKVFTYPSQTTHFGHFTPHFGQTTPQNGHLPLKTVKKLNFGGGVTFFLIKPIQFKRYFRINRGGVKLIEPYCLKFLLHHIVVYPKNLCKCIHRSVLCY